MVLRFGIVYEFECGSCNATYYGETKCVILRSESCENFGISARTAKIINCDDGSTIKEHLLFCNYAPDFEEYQQQRLPAITTLRSP